MRVNFLPMRDDCIVPTRADQGSSGWDLSIPSNDPVKVLYPGERTLIKLGFAVEMIVPDVSMYKDYLFPSGFQIDIRPRSGNAFKKGLTVLNSPGLIDASYRDQIGVILINLGQDPITLSPSDKIAQAVLTPYWSMEFEIVSELGETERGTKGFGESSGTVK